MSDRSEKAKHDFPIRTRGGREEGKARPSSGLTKDSGTTFESGKTKIRRVFGKIGAVHSLAPPLPE